MQETKQFNLLSRMWRYQQPGFALRLLCELQKQQQCSLHCDALLQTEGVSIPAHSCVLSALSPMFCRAFANAPSLQVGQSRLVQLEAVGAQALMKLVGFMYSGEMQGESLDEQQEVIDIAYRLGFGNFMEGKQKQVNRNQTITASWREIGLQTVETGGWKKDASIQILSKKRNFSHSGTQTDRAQAHFADTCFMPELSIDLPNEITGVSSEYNSISPDTGLAWVDDIAAHSPSNSTKALVRMHTKHHQTRKEKKRAKFLNKQGGTQISLKIKMKRQRSGELWEIVSVREENTVDESKSCGSSDDPLTTHSLAETHKSTEEVQLSPSSSLTCQNLETVTLTPPAELTTHLPDEPTRSPTEHHSHPDPIPLSSLLQMPHLSPALVPPKESDEQFSKLLELVTEGLNILPSVTTEENSSMYAHLDQHLEKCATVASLPTSYLCLLDHNQGTMGSRTPDASEQLEAGSDDLSSCRKSNLKNVASVASYPTSFPYTSPCIRQRKNIESSFTPPYLIVPARLNFGTGGLEHQNVVEFKTVLNNCLEGADTCAQSGKQTVNDGREVCNMQNKISRTDTSNAAQDDPTSVGKLCQEQPCVTDHLSVWQPSDVGQPFLSANSVDFSEMRLPRCLSPLTSEAAEATGVPAQDSLKKMDFSSASHVNLKPALRHTSSFQLQAFPVKTNQKNSACTSRLVNQLHCPMVGTNSFRLRLNGDHDGEANLCKSEETKERSFENDLGRSTARQRIQAANEPCRKKARIAGYTNGTDTQTIKVNPCSVNMKNIKNIESIQDIRNPGTSEGFDRLKAPEASKAESIGLKSQENLEQITDSLKCKDQEAGQKDVWDSKQIVSLVANHGHGRPLQERVCAKAQMDALSKIRKFNSSSVNPNAASSYFHHDFQLTQMSKERVPRHGNGSPPEVPHHHLGLARAEVKDLISECEKKKEPGPEKKNPILEPEKVILNVNQSREENKEPQRYSSLFNKTGFCDNIFHQTAFSVGNCLPINHQARSILQSTDKKIRTSLPPSLFCKKHYLMSTREMMDNKKEERKDALKENERERREPEIDELDEDLEKKKDKKVDPKGDIEQTESSSKNVNGCLMNVNFVRGTEISANTNLSILNAASHLQILPPARDLNSNGMENNLQNELPTTSLHPFRPAKMMEEPKTDEHITESLSEVPVSNKPTEVKLIKTNELHLEGTESTQIVNLGRQEKGTKNTVRNTEHVEISRMIEYEPGLSDIEVDVMDESTELATCHGDDVVVTEGTLDDSDVAESQMDTDGEPVAHEEEFNEQQVRRTEVMPQEGVNISSNMINNEASSIQHGEEPVTSSSLDSLSSSVMFVPDVNTESAEDCSSAEEELVVDDFTDFPVEPCTGVGTQCKTILEEENELEEEEKEVKSSKEEEEEEEDVDVTGEESN